MVSDGSLCLEGETPLVERDLHGQVSFMKRILEHSACPLVVVDGLGGVQSIVYVSPAFERLTGYMATEAMGRPWNQFLGGGDGDSQPNPLADGVRHGYEAHATLSATRRNGAVLCLDARLTQLRDSSGLITHHIIVLQDLTAQRRALESLEYRAHHDSLTELGNRHLFNDRFEQAIAYARRLEDSFALVLLDLNDFKRINDHFGHDAGDALLKQVGRRLKRAVRAEDTVARLGGDEFALLLTDGHTPRSVQTVVERVRESLSQSVCIGGSEVAVSCSLGHAGFPNEGSDFEGLLKLADVRLYADKFRFRRHRDATSPAECGAHHGLSSTMPVAQPLHHQFWRVT